jgi:hypothetical protein
VAVFANGMLRCNDIKFLQEKAAEATKQKEVEKRKNKKTLATGRHATACLGRPLVE